MMHAERTTYPRPELIGAVFLAFLAVLLFFMNRHLAMFDEGVYFTGGEEVLHGGVPHKDFHNFYGPGIYYVAAALFAVFPWKFLALRTLSLACYAAFLTAVALTGRERVGAGYRLLAAASLCLLIILFPGGQVILPLLTAVLAAAVTFVFLRAVERESAALYALSGAGAGLATVLRYDCGIMVIATFAAARVLIMLTERRFSLRALLLSGAACLGGFLLIVVPAALAYLQVATYADVKSDVIDYTLRFYTRNRALPFPTPGHIRHIPADLAVYTSVITFGLAALVVADRAPRDGAAPAAAERREQRFVITFAILALAFFTKGFVRAAWDQMMMATAIASLVAPTLLQNLTDRAGILRLARVPYALLLALPPLFALAGNLRSPYGLAAHPPLGPYALGLGRTARSQESCQPLPSMTFGRVAAEQQALVNLLDANTRPDEPVYYGSEKHDRAFANPVSLYFWSQRRPATKWYQLDPGLTTRLDIQQDMAGEFVRNDLRWIVKDSSFTDYREPNDSALSSGVTFLDDWIAARFRPVGQVGPYRIWARKDVPAAAIRWPSCPSSEVPAITRL